MDLCVHTYVRLVTRAAVADHGTQGPNSTANVSRDHASVWRTEAPLSTIERRAYGGTCRSADPSIRAGARVQAPRHSGRRSVRSCRRSGAATADMSSRPQIRVREVAAPSHATVAGISADVHSRAQNGAKSTPSRLSATTGGATTLPPA